MKRVLVLAMTFVLLIGASVSAAKMPVTVYASVDEENARKILSAFTQATGIPVNFVFLSSGPALARLEAEANNPQADLWLGAPSENHILAKERGLTQSYVSPSAKPLDGKFKDAEGYWHAFYMNPLGVGVRTDFLERVGAKLPITWEELFAETFKGEIQMPTPQSSGTAYNLVASFVLKMGEDQAFEYLARLHQNVQTYTQSGTAPSKALAIGQANVAIQFTPAFLQLIDEGYPVKLVFPAEGVGYEAAAVSIVKGARNLEGAQALVDWVLSVQGQNILSSEKTYFFPVHPDAELGAGLPGLSEINLIEYDAAWAGQNKARLVERWVNEVLRK